MARPRVLRSKTLPQAEFISAEEVQSKGGPARLAVWGRFGADMQVYSQNDGPVTILLEL